MSALTLDARKHAAAIKTVVSAALGTKWNAFDYGEVPGYDGNPGPKPDLFALVSVDMVPATGQRMSAQTGMTRWIASVRGVGPTVQEAQWVLFKAMGVLHEARLTIDGRDTTPLQASNGQAPRKDGPAYSGLAVYTYSH